MLSVIGQKVIIFTEQSGHSPSFSKVKVKPKQNERKTPYAASKVKGYLLCL